MSDRFLSSPDVENTNHTGPMPISPQPTHHSDPYISSKWPLPFSPLQSIQEHSRTKYKNTCTQSIHKTTKLSQSQTAQYQDTPYIESMDIIYNKQQHNIYPISEPQKTQYKAKRKRRASQPHPHQTMMYSPISMDSPLSPNKILSDSYYTKRQLNELRMKHYNETHQSTKKHRRYSFDTTHSVYDRKTPIQKKPSIPIDRSYDDLPQTTVHTKTKTKTTTTQYSILNHNNPYIDESVTSSSMSSMSSIAPDISRYKKKNTKISRRKSKSKQEIMNDPQYKHKIQIKSRKKNRIKRCESYDNSYTQCNDEDIDPQINNCKSNGSTLTPEYNNMDNTLSRKTLKKKRKRCDSKKRKKKKKKEGIHNKTNEKIKRKKKKKKRGESALFNKQILRVREGKLGQRVVTFSRRNSVFSQKENDDLIELKKSLDEEKKKLDEERVRMECLTKEMNDRECKLVEEENAYGIRLKALELKEEESRSKQVMLLRDEIEINDDKCKLKKKEKWMNKQTSRFDTVLSDFYVYQHSVNAMCNKHIELMDEWMESAQNVVNNMRECVMNPIQETLYDILKYKDLEDQDRDKFEEYTTKMNGIYNLSESELGFEDINKIENELKHMPRPNISKQQSMECEMRLQDKWRDYLSVRFGDEYEYPSSKDEDDSTDISDEKTLSGDELVLDQDIQDDTDDDDSKMSELEVIDDIIDDDMNKHQHRRTVTSFLKTPPFLDNFDPFWSLKYDSQNEIDDGDLLDLELELTRNSKSSAIMNTDAMEYDALN